MRCFGLQVTLLHISLKTADDIVENNDQVILAGLEAETFSVIGTHDNNYNKKFWQDQVKIFLIMLNRSTTKKWKFVDLKFTYKKDSLVTIFKAKTAEWLRRWTVNPLVPACVGSNPIFVVFSIDSML